MYLERFTLPDAEQEEELIMERICGLRELYFQKTAILYGATAPAKAPCLI